MGGPSKHLQQSQEKLADSQATAAQQFANLSQQSLSQMNTLTQPAVNHDMGLINAANSGNYSQLIQAAGPTVGANSQAAQQAAQNIRNNIPAGAGQQAALAQIPFQLGNANAGALNQAYTGALGNLTQIGAAYGGVGLNEAGISTNSANAAGSAYGQIGNEQAQSKATTMGFLGSLAGAAGTAAGGGAFK